MNRSMLPAPAVLLLAALATTACSGLSSWSDYDPGRVDTVRGYQTWDWAYSKDGSVGDIRSSDRVVDDPFVDQRIRSAIESNLLEKGYHRAEGGNPDFRVGYHVSINGQMDVTYINSYYGYGWGGYWGPYGPSYGMSYSTPSVRYYNEGMLLVDVVDAAANELAWRGGVEGEVHEKRDARERQEAIDRAVKEALKDFPPG